MDFDGIYRLYFRDVYVFSLALTANRSAAQELTQETFFKALKAIDQFDGSNDIRAWLFTIARNTFYTDRKLQARYSSAEPDEALPSCECGLEERLIDQESAFRIHQFLHTMKEPYKEVFSLRTFGELSFEKIGQLFGKSPGWARVTYHRAKKQIQDHLEVTG